MVDTESAARAAASVPHSEDLAPEAVKAVLDVLKKNPAVPFDLSRKTRVFSTKFQFIELTRSGAEWTQRTMTLSSLLLNADLPAALRDILDTAIRPFKNSADQKFRVPLVVDGQRAFDEKGERLMVNKSQAELSNDWDAILEEYLCDVKPFGKLIRREDVPRMRKAIDAYLESLRAWVSAFKKGMRENREENIKMIVEAIVHRMAKLPLKSQLDEDDIRCQVEKSLKKMGITEPSVRIVIKDVAWSSTRDEEFLAAIKRAVPPEALDGWFNEFTAAPEMGKDAPRR